MQMLQDLARPMQGQPGCSIIDRGQPTADNSINSLSRAGTNNDSVTTRSRPHPASSLCTRAAPRLLSAPPPACRRHTTAGTLWRGCSRASAAAAARGPRTRRRPPRRQPLHSFGLFRPRAVGTTISLRAAARSGQRGSR